MLPIAEFAFPGPLRDKLVSAILNGIKTSTTSLLVEYQIENEALPLVGLRQIVVDSNNKPFAEIETTRVKQVKLADVDLQHAKDEGEGYGSVNDWRAEHEKFWHSEEFRGSINNPTFFVNDETIVVLEYFRLIKLL